MANKTKTRIANRKDSYSHIIGIEKSDGEKFIIPVIDVRDGDTERELIKKQLKANNKSRRSKFIR